MKTTARETKKAYTYKEYADGYELETTRKNIAIKFFNSVKRSTPHGWQCVLFKKNGNSYGIRFLSAGYIVDGVTNKPVEYVKTFNKL